MRWLGMGRIVMSWGMGQGGMEQDTLDEMGWGAGWGGGGER